MLYCPLNRLFKDRIFLVIVAAIAVATVIKLAHYNIVFLYIALAVVMIGLSKYALDLLTMLKLQIK